ncbi:hypothetical protein [Amycolatopsis sp.]|uniref:hypothetical protein n=1 Tax=Amycolatopsis sp. TaxID=37632 RepID=UPI002D803EBD|nr:hypothetical protein [Amycolatopsis sp.]HET6709729.1 hypothetical protein [Amycolatopsis sp.]
MACGSCGGGGRTYPVLTGVANDQSGAAAAGEWTVTYPNGAVVSFRNEWQAKQAVAISGGTLTPPE